MDMAPRSEIQWSCSGDILDAARSAAECYWASSSPRSRSMLRYKLSVSPESEFESSHRRRERMLPVAIATHESAAP